MPTSPLALALAIDPSRCPLCGQPNQCANEIERETGIPQPPCWCTTAVFDAALLESVPAEAQHKTCICAQCARSAAQSASKA